MFINLLRSVPENPTVPHAGGVVWACSSMQAQLERPGMEWIELVVYAADQAEYVTSEDGGCLGFGYNAEEDWYSFPAKCVVQWRRVGEENWRNGPGWKDHGRELRELQRQQTIQKKARREKMVVDGIDYEALLEQEGLGELEV